jgi:hypothetical protein
VLNGVVPVRVGIDDANLTFTPPTAGPSWVETKDYDPVSGLLTVGVNLAAFGGTGGEFETDRQNFCQPRNYCAWNATSSTCGCAVSSDCTDNAVCAWAVKEIDCPTGGCFGFQFTLPNQFSTGQRAGLPPATTLFTNAPNESENWQVPFFYVDVTISGAQCYYDKPPNM